MYLVRPMRGRRLNLAVVMSDRMAKMEASDWSSDVMTGSGMGYR